MKRKRLSCLFSHHGDDLMTSIPVSSFQVAPQIAGHTSKIRLPTCEIRSSNDWNSYAAHTHAFTQPNHTRDSLLLPLLLLHDLFFTSQDAPAASHPGRSNGDERHPRFGHVELCEKLLRRHRLLPRLQPGRRRLRLQAAAQPDVLRRALLGPRMPRRQSAM